jgi:hypothetical protein
MDHNTTKYEPQSQQEEPEAKSGASIYDTAQVITDENELAEVVRPESRENDNTILDLTQLGLENGIGVIVEGLRRVASIDDHRNQPIFPKDSSASLPPNTTTQVVDIDSKSQDKKTGVADNVFSIEAKPIESLTNAITELTRVFGSTDEFLQAMVHRKDDSSQENPDVRF